MPLPNNPRSGRCQVRREQKVEVHIAGHTGLLGLVHEDGRTADVTLGQPVAGCAGTADSHGPCLIDRVTGEPIAVARARRFDGHAAARLAGLGISTGLTVYCLTQCHDPAAAFGTAALLVAYLLLLQPFSFLT